MKRLRLLIRLVCVVVAAVAPLAALFYLFLRMFQLHGGNHLSGAALWATALQVAVPAAAVELGITLVVLLWARAMSTDPTSGSARAVAVAVAAVCASIPTAFFVNMAAWPVVVLCCVLPAGLAAPALMRPVAVTAVPES
ncbi:hypothetical protein ACF05L_37245 [Streptomyces bobili]|uniref:hypothetical protein n=1 Tax=Streptomyces bobili TaxID=67280 RepID=UPI0036FE44E8